MTKPQTGKQYRRLKTSEMVVYPMLVVILIGVTFGFYNSKIEDTSVRRREFGAGAGGSCRGLFKTTGAMPQSEADLNLSAFTAEGMLTSMDYRAGELGVPAADKLRTGTLRALVDMTEFGTRFEKLNPASCSLRELRMTTPSNGLVLQTRSQWTL